MSQIKKYLENLIKQYGFTPQLEVLNTQKTSGQISPHQFQLAVEQLAAELPFTPLEIEELLVIFDRNIQEMVEAPLIIGNGDIKDLNDLHTKGGLYNWDGGMIGRGVFDNPFAFNPKLLNSSDISTVDRIKLLEYHLNLWVKTWGETKNYQALKKFFKIYISGFEGSVALRAKLMESKNPNDALVILSNFLEPVLGN